MLSSMNTQSTTVHTWTDEQLRNAVASQHSWRGVLRELGLEPQSAGATRKVRRRAAELDLDASHFTGQRRWSDVKLREAVAQASSWTDVMYRIGAHERCRASVLAHAARLKLDTSHFGPQRLDPPPVDFFTAVPQPKMLRTAAQSIAIAWFLLRDIPVAVPPEPKEYDLLVTMQGGVQRVQVKSSTRRTRSGTWDVGIGRRPYRLDKSAGRESYEPDSLDYFFLIAGDGAIYLVPSQVLVGRVSVFLSVLDRYRVGSAASLLDWEGEVAV